MARISSEDPTTKTNICPLDLVDGVKVTCSPHFLYGLGDENISPVDTENSIHNSKVQYVIVLNSPLQI